MKTTQVLTEKFREAAASVLPVCGIVVVLCLFFMPITPDLLLSFCIGSQLLIVGMALFTMGSELSMTQIGIHMGAKLTKSRKLWLILSISFLLGAVITIAEPDLQVLANSVPSIDTTVLIITVAVGVGFFLLMSMLRILLAIPLRWLLLAFYGLVFLLAAFCDKNFLSVAFDAGGVTTGPMTVPFIMALGVGVASIRSDKRAQEDSFGLVALCSIGPVLAVLLLSFIYRGAPSADVTSTAAFHADTVSLGHEYLLAIPHSLLEVFLALLPIAAFFLIFQAVSLRLGMLPFMRILVGLLYTTVGLVLFLTGVNVGFSSVGQVLGERLALSAWRFALIPLSMVLGWFIINAEPAVHVLNRQVEELSAGAISAKTMGLSLSIAISAANGLAMVRVLTGLPILWFAAPGYIIALALSFFVPQTFTAIAFDSGGVASGPLTATFMLPLALGASSALGGNVMTDAFGLVAMVAMMPLITVQLMGAISTFKTRRTQAMQQAMPAYGQMDVIELWEV